MFYGFHMVSMCSYIHLNISGDIVQVTDPVQDATLPPGNDPNMDDYVDWEWDTEPTSTAVKVIPTTSFLFLLMCSFLYFLH